MSVRFVFVLAALSAFPAVASAQTAPLAIRSAHVVDVETGDVLAGQTVLVVGDRIAAVGPDAEADVPADATVLDAAGGYLVPGLWDMHVHASNGGRAPRHWPTLVAHGVTGFRELGSHPDSLVYWKAQAEAPGSRAPRVYWGAMVDGVPPVYDMSVQAGNAAGGASAVDLVASLGLDFAKVYDRVGRDAYFALAERAEERGVPFVGHVPTSVTMAEAVGAGQASFEHATDLLIACTPGTPALPPSLVRANAPSSPEEGAAVQALFGLIVSTPPTAEACADLLTAMREAGAWLTPTMALARSIAKPRSFLDDPRHARVPPGQLAVWEASRFPEPMEAQIGDVLWARTLEIVRIAHEAGIPLLAGTDASNMPYVFVGSSLHDELAYLVEAGLAPLEALRTATLDAARFMGRESDVGTIEAGKAADLVLLDANPLDDIANVRGVRAVVLRGEWLDRDALDRMAAQEWAGVE